MRFYLELRVWALAGILISSLLLVWVRLENGNAEAMALTDTLLRVPISVVVGVLVGALVAVLEHAGKPPAQVLQESVDWDAPARLRVVRADSRPPSVNFVDSSRQREPKWVTSPNW